jgi:hypothetical protein
MTDTAEARPPSNAPPALLEHCTNVYNAMQVRAAKTPEGLVYEGFLTQLFVELDLSIPYYTHVMRKLKAMDCVRQLRRGGGSAPSRWLLLQDPSLELFMAITTDISERINKRANRDVLQQQIIDLGRRVSSLEARIGHLEEVAEGA